MAGQGVELGRIQPAQRGGVGVGKVDDDRIEPPHGDVRGAA